MELDSEREKVISELRRGEKNDPANAKRANEAANKAMVNPESVELQSNLMKILAKNGKKASDNMGEFLDVLEEIEKLDPAKNIDGIQKAFKKLIGGVAGADLEAAKFAKNYKRAVNSVASISSDLNVQIEEVRKKMASVSDPTILGGLTKQQNLLEFIKKQYKELGDGAFKFSSQIKNAKTPEEIEKVSQAIARASAEQKKSFRLMSAESGISRSYEAGVEEIENYAIALKGVPFAAAAVGTYALAKAVNSLSDKFLNSAMKYKELKREMAIGLETKRGGFPTTIKQLTEIGRGLNLTREETAKFGKVLKDAAQQGIGFDKVNSIAQNLQRTMGALNVDELKSAVDLLKTLPDNQINFALKGTGSFDDEFGMISNLMKDGKLSEYIELQAKGAFGMDDLGDKGFTAGDKEQIKAQKNIESGIDDFKNKSLDLMSGSFVPYLTTAAQGITTLVGLVGTIAFAVGAAKGMGLLKDMGSPANSLGAGGDFSKLSGMGKVGAGLGMAGAVVGVAAAGVALGEAADKFFGISDKIANSGGEKRDDGTTVFNYAKEAKHSEKYIKTKEKERKLIEKTRKKMMEGILTLDSLNNELKRAEGIAIYGKALKESATAQIGIFKAMGSSMYSYQDAVTKSLEGTTTAYTSEVGEIRRIRQSALDDETMSSAQRTKILMQSTLQEAKATEEFVKGLVDTIGKYNEIPDVIVNNLKTSMEVMKGAIIEWAGMFGSSSELMETKTKIVALKMDSLTKSLSQYSKEQSIVTDSIKKLKGMREAFDVNKFNKAQDEATNAGFGVKKVEVGEGGKLNEKAKAINDENIDKITKAIDESNIRKVKINEKIKATPKIDKTENEFLGINTGINEIKDNLKYSSEEDIANKIKNEVKLGKKTYSEDRSGAANNFEKKTGQHSAIGINVAGIEKKISELDESNAESKKIKEDIKKAFEKFKSSGTIADLEETRKLFQSLEKSNDAIRASAQEELNSLDKRIDIGNKSVEAFGQVTKITDLSVVEAKSAEALLQGLKEQMGGVAEAYGGLVETIDKTAGVVLGKKLVENVEAGAEYSKMFGAGLKYYADSFKVQIYELKEQSNAIDLANKNLQDLNVKTAIVKDTWGALKDSFSKIDTGTDVDLGKIKQDVVKNSEDRIKAEELLASATLSKDDTAINKYRGQIEKYAEERKKLMEAIDNKIGEVSKSGNVEALRKATEKEGGLKTSVESKQKAMEEESDGTKKAELKKSFDAENELYEDAVKKREAIAARLTSAEKAVSNMANGADALGKASEATTIKLNSQVKAEIDLDTKRKNMLSETVAMWQKIDTMVEEVVSKDIGMKKFTSEMDAASASLDNVALSLDPVEIAKAGSRLRRNSIMEEKNRVALVKKATAMAEEDARKALDASNKLAQTDEQRAENQLAYDNVVAQNEMKNANAEATLKTKVAEMAQKEFDKQRRIVDLKEQSLKVELDIMEAIGGPFETIFGIEVKMVDLARDRMDIAHKELAIAEEKTKEQGRDEDDIARLRIAARQAEGEVIKKQMGAQRSAMEKMLGGMLTTFQQVGAFKGPSRASIYGTGYMVEGDVESGQVMQHGKQATEDMKKTGTVGYANRVARTSLDGTIGRGTSTTPDRFGGVGAEGLAKGMAQKNAMTKDLWGNSTKPTEDAKKTAVMEHIAVVADDINKTLKDVLGGLHDNTIAVSDNTAIGEQGSKLDNKGQKIDKLDLKATKADEKATNKNALAVAKNTGVTTNDGKASDANTDATVKNTDNINKGSSFGGMQKMFSGFSGGEGKGGRGGRGKSPSAGILGGGITSMGAKGDLGGGIGSLSKNNVSAVKSSRTGAFKKQQDKQEPMAGKPNSKQVEELKKLSEDLKNNNEEISRLTDMKKYASKSSKGTKYLDEKIKGLSGGSEDIKKQIKSKSEEAWGKPQGAGGFKVSDKDANAIMKKQIEKQKEKLKGSKDLGLNDVDAQKEKLKKMEDQYKKYDKSYNSDSEVSIVKDKIEKTKEELNGMKDEQGMRDALTDLQNKEAKLVGEISAREGLASSLKNAYDKAQKEHDDLKKQYTVNKKIIEEGRDPTAMNDLSDDTGKLDKDKATKFLEDQKKEISDKQVNVAMKHADVVSNESAINLAKTGVGNVSKDIKENTVAINTIETKKKEKEQLLASLPKESTVTSSNTPTVDVASTDTGVKPKAFSTGGFTGDGGVKEPKGVVHGGEYVIPKWQVKSNPSLIDKIEQSRKSKTKLVPYDMGGVVAGAGKLKALYDDYTKAKKVGFTSTADLPTFAKDKDLASNLWGMGMKANQTATNAATATDTVDIVAKTASKGADLTSKTIGGTEMAGKVIKGADKVASVASKASNVLGLGDVLDKTGNVSKVAKVGSKIGAGNILAATNVLASGVDTVFTDEDGNFNWSTDTDMAARLANKGEKSLQAGSTNMARGMWEGASNPIQTIAGATKGVSDIFSEIGSNKEKEANIKLMQEKLQAQQLKKGKMEDVSKGLFGPGGYSSGGSVKQPKGVVHGGEYVVPKWQVNDNPNLIANMEQGRKSGRMPPLQPFEDGGSVGRKVPQSSLATLGVGSPSKQSTDASNALNSQGAGDDMASGKATAQKIDINVNVAFNNAMFKQEVIKIVTDFSVASQTVQRAMGQKPGF